MVTLPRVSARLHKSTFQRVCCAWVSLNIVKAQLERLQDYFEDFLGQCSKKGHEVASRKCYRIKSTGQSDITAQEMDWLCPRTGSGLLLFMWDLGCGSGGSDPFSHWWCGQSQKLSLGLSAAFWLHFLFMSTWIFTSLKHTFLHQQKYRKIKSFEKMGSVLFICIFHFHLHFFLIPSLVF